MNLIEHPKEVLHLGLLRISISLFLPNRSNQSSALAIRDTADIRDYNFEYLTIWQLCCSFIVKKLMPKNDWKLSCCLYCLYNIFIYEVNFVNEIAPN